MADGTVLLALPTVQQIGELIQTMFGEFELPVRLPDGRERPVDALARTLDEVDGCLVCCDHPRAMLDEVVALAREAELPTVLFSSRKRADDVRRVAAQLGLPWVDLTRDPETIVGSVKQVVER